MADLLSLVARLSIDTSEYEAGIKQSEGSMSKLGNFVKGGIKKVALGSVAAIGAATAAAGTLAKKSVEGYAEQEQLVGGVQKLYGNMGMSLKEYAKSMGISTKEAKSQWQTLEKAQNTVLKNAQNAYKSAGMSASEYMEIATSFSASLINSLGGDTVKAAKQTDVAVQAISDNFNTFGGDLGMIQGAFQGFAKQNYTMLDNLKLGYGGTKKEMERLIEDANAYAKANGQAADLSIDSFSDIVTAIDLIQQKQNIAGTTSREVSKTIAGSFQALKSAWDNLVTGFADPNADVGQLVENVVKSAGTAIKNVLPAFSQALKGISTAIGEVLPQAMEKIPELIKNFGQPLIETGASLVLSIITGIQENVPQMLTAASEMITSFGEGLVTNIPTLLSNVLPMIEQFTENLRNSAGSLVDVGLNFITNLAQGIINSIPTLVSYIPQIVINIAGIINDNVPKILKTGVNIVVSLVKGIISAMPTIVANIPKIIQAIYSVWMAFNWVDLGTSIINFIKNGISTAINILPQMLKNLGENAANAFKGGINVLSTSVPQLLTKIGKAAVNAFKSINWTALGKATITLIRNGLSVAAGLILRGLATIGRAGLNAFKKINWKEVGSAAIKFIGNGLKSAGKLILTALKTIGKTAWNGFKSINWWDLGKNIISGIVRGIGSAAGALFGKLKGLASDALAAAKKALKIGSPSKLFDEEVGQQIPAGMARGVDKAKYLVKNSIDRLNNLVIGDMLQFDPDDQFSSFSALSTSNDYQVPTTEILETPDKSPKNVTINNYITVDGSENPQEWTEEFVRTLKLEMRTE